MVLSAPKTDWRVLFGYFKRTERGKINYFLTHLAYLIKKKVCNFANLFLLSYFENKLFTIRDITCKQICSPCSSKNWYWIWNLNLCLRQKSDCLINWRSWWCYNKFIYGVFYDCSAIRTTTNFIETIIITSSISSVPFIVKLAPPDVAIGKE